MIFLISGKTVNLLKLKYTFIYFYIETHTVSNVHSATHHILYSLN